MLLRYSHLSKLLWRYFSSISVTILLCLGSQGQNSIPQLLPGTARKAGGIASIPEPTLQVIPLTVPQGTPLQVALADEVRVRKVGQLIEGKIVEPVYAFDRVVI